MGRRPNNGSDYLEYINKSGSIRELSIRVSKDANVDASEVILKLPRVLDKLTEKQAKVIRKYYLQENSISNIKESMGFTSYAAVDKCIDSGVKRIIKCIALL